jgi:putative proteasome-type protease
MTYWVFMLLDLGLAFLSDSRTTAGVNPINTFRKTTVSEIPGERVIVMLSAGNLAITQGVEFNTSFIVGGQIKGEPPRLFSSYSAGEFVEAIADTTYFQIGESKYGKPIIDRVTRRSMPLSEAAKCALISMDSTIRSNLTVGLPLELVIMRRDEYRVASHVDIGTENKNLQMIRRAWGEALREAFSELPNPDGLGIR